MVVSVFVEACVGEVFVELARLGKAVDTFANFEIDPSIAVFFSEVVFLYKFIRNIGWADALIFIEVERGVQLKVANVETGEAYITEIYDTVENEFFKFK